MSYDVYLLADLGGPELVTVTGLNANYTYNCGPMLKEAVGVWLSELNGRLCSEVLPLLRLAIDKMKSDPRRYELLNPDNGWGDSIGWMDFLTKIANACELAPKAMVHVG